MKKKPMYLHETAGGVPPLVNRRHDATFKSDAAYRATLPDMMEAVNAAEARACRSSRWAARISGCR